MDEPVQEGLPRKAAAGERQRHENAEGQAHERGHGRDAQRQGHGAPFVGGKPVGHHFRIVNPCASKTAAASGAPSRSKKARSAASSAPVSSAAG